MTMEKDSINEENKVQHNVQSLESKGESLACRSELDPQQTLLSNVRSLGATSSCKELFFLNTHGFPNSIPKHITTSDEKYVLRCLELIRDYALRAEAWALTSKALILPDEWTNQAERKTTASHGMIRFAKKCHLIGGTDKIVNSSGELTIGGIADSQSMLSILKSPLLQQFGSVDFDASILSTDSCDASEEVRCAAVDFRHKSNSTLWQKSPNQATLVNRKLASAPVHMRHVSVSSTNSSCSDQSSSSASATSFQGMLQCTWKNGLPHHVFSVDDKKEVYVANLYKVESSDDKSLDYVYNFRSRKTQDKELDTQELELDSVAVMRVSTSISFCPNNSEVRETQFLLFVPDDTNQKLQAANQTRRKKKGSTKKSRYTYKQKSFPKFLGSSAIFEDTPWDPSEDVPSNIDPIETIVGRSYAPNHELAAIVVKDISKNRQESNPGGWGLKFLKKFCTDVSLEDCQTSESTRSTGECSTSMDIVIPAGIHGGPKVQVGGPSSLIERWTTGGSCDCGGWDAGCPLTILSTKSSSLDTLSHMDNSGQCKSVDFFMKGSKLDVPVLKMASIHEGLFYIHFQSSLSSLQSFAIAAAIIHSRSPSLRL